MRRDLADTGKVLVLFSIDSLSLPCMSSLFCRFNRIPLIRGANLLICSHGPSPAPVWSAYPDRNSYATFSRFTDSITLVSSVRSGNSLR